MLKRLGSKDLKCKLESGGSARRGNNSNNAGVEDTIDVEEEDANTRGAHLKLAQRHRKIVAGRFKGRRVFEPEEAAPGVRGQVAICFTTNGELPKESRLTCQLPDHGWGISASPAPNAMLRLPQGCAVPTLKTVWQPATRTLEFTLMDESISSDTSVVILVSGVHTPESATPQAEIVVTAYAKLVVRTTVPQSTRGGQIIDGPCQFVVPKILPGQITGAKRWLPFSCFPGVVSDVSLSFCVNGKVPMGGKILIELPVGGWDMDDRPRVLLRNAQYHNVQVPATWDRTQHALEIAVPTTGGASPIPMKSNVKLTIAKVRNPTKETMSGAYTGAAAASARITTLSASGGVIDGPSKLDVARISELRESDFEGAITSFDEEDVEKRGAILAERIPDVLKRARVQLSAELYQSLVVANFPIRMHADQSDASSSVAVAVPPSVSGEGDDGNADEAQSVDKDKIRKDEFLNLFASVYAPAYKYGQELRAACGRGHVEKVREWISRGCDPNAKDGSGWSALHYAADFGQLEVLHTLLDMTTSAVSSSNPGNSLQHLELNARDGCGWTPLMCAAANGHTRIVEKLISDGADPLLASVEGRTALHWAGSRGMDETVRVLLDARGGDQIDHVDRSGWSVLHCAMLHGSSQCTMLLLENGADKSLKDKLQYPPTRYSGPALPAETEAAIEDQAQANRRRASVAKTS